MPTQQVSGEMNDVPLKYQSILDCLIKSQKNGTGEISTVLDTEATATSSYYYQKQVTSSHPLVNIGGRKIICSV
jgi:hypothetical protein